MNPDELLKKAKALSQQTTVQGATPFAGSSFDFKTPTISDTLDASRVGAPPLTVPPQPQLNQDYVSLVSSLQSARQKELEGNLAKANKDVEAPQAENQGLINRYKELLGITKNKEIDQATLSQQAGIDAQAKDIKELTNQVDQIANETIAQQLSLQGRGEGVPLAIIGGQQAQVQKQNAIKSLIISSAIQAKQGNLSSAQASIQRAIDEKYRSAESELKYTRDLIDINMSQLSPAEKKQAEAQKASIDFKEEQLKSAIRNEESIGKILTEAAANGAPNAVLSQIEASMAKGDIMEAITVAGEYGGDMVSRQIKNAQLQKLYGDIAEQTTGGQIATDQGGKVFIKPAEALKINKELVSGDSYKAIRKAQDSLQFLNEFEKTFNQVGLETLPSANKSKLRTQYNTTMLNLKEFFNLGVLNGPDLEILKGIIPDPTTGYFKQFSGTKSAVSEGIASMKAQIEATLDDRFKSVSSQYGDYSPQSIRSLGDLGRIYVEQKAKVNPDIAKLIRENPNYTQEDIISIIVK